MGVRLTRLRRGRRRRIRTFRLDRDTHLGGDAHRQRSNPLIADPDFNPSYNRQRDTSDVQINLGSGDRVEVAAARLATMVQTITPPPA